MKPASQPKIIFFDIDDTLRPKESGTVPDSTREALRKLKRQGIVTAIATGRSPVILPADIRRLMDETGIEMLVAINGQYVEYCLRAGIGQRHRHTRHKRPSARSLILAVHSLSNRQPAARHTRLPNAGLLR